MSVEVIDTTGAGDAATGAYLALRLARASIDGSLCGPRCGLGL